MTALDWVIIAFATLMAVYGYGQGFIVGALSLVGFAGGAFLGTRLGPELLPEGSASPYAPLFGLVGALIAGAILATGLESAALALRRRIRIPGLATVDGALGAVLTVCVALGIAWIGGAVALQTAQDADVRRAVQRSEVLRRLNAALPPSGPILNALARFDPFPRIDGPPANVGPPDSAIARDPEVRAAGEGVVRVLSTACGLGIAGSGWVARDGVVVTNAHVVAGADDTTVQVGGGGSRLDAQAIHFDATNDIAVLEVDDLDARSLRLASDPRPGISGAVLGYPENGPYDVEPARLGDTLTVTSQDAYGRGPVRRSITSLRGSVREGNSGGPMVDGAGRVVTTVFAATVGAARAGGYGVPNDVVRGALADRGGPVSTGPCAR
jgi:S1-C subfamily serine protease